MNIYFLSFIRSVAFSFSSVLIWQLSWRLLGWLRGSNLLPGQCKAFLLFTYTLILVLIMFVVSTRKKRTGKSEKPRPELVRFNSQHYHSGNKNAACTQACTHTLQLYRMNPSHILTHIWRQIQSITAASKPSFHSFLHMHTTTITTFIWCEAQQVFECQSINIDSHFSGTY